MNEPQIHVHHREQLAELLTEAVEVEHNLMCCYLFAAWSLKSGVAEGLTEAQARDVARWRQTIVHVAIDEMTHFANANNILSAIGGRPHLGRPNFPVSPGYHPAGVVVELRRFEPATVDHFVFLERPEGVALHDGEGYASPRPYARGTSPQVLMPTAQDYATVGHLYRGIRAGLEQLAHTLSPSVLFTGAPERQIDPSIVQLDGLVAVRDLPSALQAIDNIVEQGEGNVSNPEDSHYRRFLAIREALGAHLRDDPSFDPARRVVRNPVQRQPPVPDGKHWIGAPQAAAVLDLANAIYNHMLRILGTAYEAIPAATRRGLIDEAIGSMQLLVPLNDVLTGLAANPDQPDARAGMSFAVSREIRVPAPEPAVRVLAERTRVLAEGASRLAQQDPRVSAVAQALEHMAARIEALP